MPRYPMLTITENRMGDFHIWGGRKHVNTTEPYNHKVNGEESPVYYQSESDKETIKEYLTPQQIKDLGAGWTVHTTRVPPDYFPDHIYDPEWYMPTK